MAGDITSDIRDNVCIMKQYANLRVSARVGHTLRRYQAVRGMPRYSYTSFQQSANAVFAYYILHVLSFIGNIPSRARWFAFAGTVIRCNGVKRYCSAAQFSRLMRKLRGKYGGSSRATLISRNRANQFRASTSPSNCSRCARGALCCVREREKRERK